MDNYSEHQNVGQDACADKEEGYVPRPAWQVWAARVGLVIVIVGVILYCLRMAGGGL